MADVETLKIVMPRWRRAVAWVWIRGLVIAEMIVPGSVDEDRATSRIARFLCVVRFDA